MVFATGILTSSVGVSVWRFRDSHFKYGGECTQILFCLSVIFGTMHMFDEDKSWGRTRP